MWYRLAKSIPETLEEFQTLHLDTPLGGGSKSPSDVFGWKPGDYETLHDLAHQEDSFRLEEVLGKGYSFPHSLHLSNDILENRPLRVYRAIEEGEEIVPYILPGSYVTESLVYAVGHAEDNFGGRPYRVVSMEIPAKDLMTYGDPHEFIYVPQSPEDGFDRFRAHVSDPQEIPRSTLRKVKRQYQL